MEQIFHTFTIQMPFVLISEVLLIMYMHVAKVTIKTVERYVMLFSFHDLLLTNLDTCSKSSISHCYELLCSCLQHI